MPRIHHFQRYSSPENTVTNNTLQLLNRIYSHSTAQASTLLSEITGEQIEVGIGITQQERSDLSVPDGIVVQRGFKLLIEAKVDSAVDEGQLIRHASSFASSDSQKLLLLLTKQELSQQEQSRIRGKIKAQYSDVIFKAVTFEQICKTISGLFKDYEYGINEIVEDYIEYCNDTELFDQSRYLMRIVPCGQSRDINKRFGIYFHPSDRGYTRHSYVGIYADKCVQSIWKIDAVFDVKLSTGQLEKSLVDGENTDRFDENIVSIIHAAERECGYSDVSTGCRFFCGKPFDTNFRKTSKGGIQGARFVNLKELLGRIDDPETMAQQLTAKTWK